MFMKNVSFLFHDVLAGAQLIQREFVRWACEPQQEKLPSYGVEVPRSAHAR